jgi:hypothetical protein
MVLDLRRKEWKKTDTEKETKIHKERKDGGIQSF